MTQTSQIYLKRGAVTSSSASTPITQIRQKLQAKKKYIAQQLSNLEKQIQNKVAEEQTENSKQLQLQAYSLQNQRKINPMLILNEVRQLLTNCNDQIPYFKSKDNYVGKQFQIIQMPHGVFYPPSCAGYDIAFCKNNQTIYVYGGISCNSELNEGLKQYFFGFNEFQGWKEIKVVSNYCPMPRYGHTLTGTNDSLLLFGGVSEYKEKLKDRCFYSDVWSFSTHKNSWKVLQFSGIMPKTRRNHTACLYQKYYIIQGGLDDSEQVISSISWVNLDEKRSRWRHKIMQGRYNHQISVHQTQHGRDFLFVFGGRNTDSDVIGNFVMYPINISEGQLHFKQSFKFNWGLQPCQFPIMKNIQNGVIIMGGINYQNEAADQCWYFNPEKQSAVPIQNEIDWGELRAAKGVSISNKQVYVLSGANSKKYKAIKILMAQEREDEFKFKN